MGAQKLITNYLVLVWHAKADETKEYTIPWQEACPPGSNLPNKQIAALKARKRFAAERGEDYDWVVHQVLSVKEVAA
jgi:hypothetical protein